MRRSSGQAFVPVRCAVKHKMPCLDAIKGAAATSEKISAGRFPYTAERLALATITAGFAFFRADLAAATGFSQL